MSFSEDFQYALNEEHMAGHVPEWDGEDAFVIPGFMVENQQYSNWCWAAVGNALYSFWCKPDTPLSQTEFAVEFSGSDGNDPQSMLAILDGIEMTGSTPVHQPMPIENEQASADLRERTEQNIRAGRPVPIDISWYNKITGHVVCAYGTTKLNGEQALMVYDPSNTDTHLDNRTVLIWVRRYQNISCIDGVCEDLSGYIKFIYMPDYVETI